ncbi:MAG: APC family permease, partial [Trebonia sp.]
VLTMASLSAIPFIIMSIAIIVQGGDAGNTWSVFDPGQTNAHAVFTGILFAILLFVGFEAAASIAEEMHAPRKQVPVAIIGTVLICACFYLLVCYAATIGFGKVALGHNAWGGSPDAMGVLAQRYVGSWLSVLVDLGVIFDALSLGIAIMVTSSRLFFAFARDGLLPKWIAKTSRYNTPLAGNLILVGWGGIILIWTAVTPYAPTGLGRDLVTFGISADAGSFLVETIYVFLGIFALRIVWTEFHGVWPRVWRLIAVGVGIAAPILAFYGSLSPFPPEPTAQAVWIWIAFGVLSLIWLMWLIRKRPAQVRAAAAYADASPEPEAAGAARAQPGLARG